MTEKPHRGVVAMGEAQQIRLQLSRHADVLLELANRPVCVETTDDPRPTTDP